MGLAERRVWLTAALGLIAVSVIVWRPVVRSDAFIYAATGRWIVEHRSIPVVDPFSWTYGGQPWQSNGWAWGVVLWAAYSLGGFAGMAALKPLLVLALGATSAFAARTLGARPVPSAVGAVLAPLLVTTWLNERPQVASYVIFPLALAVAARSWRGGSIRFGWLAALSAVFVVWANVHTVVLFGIIVIASMAGSVAAVGIIRERDWRPVAAPMAAVIVACVSVLANPWGTGLITHALEVRGVSAATITEWYPLVRSGSNAILPLVVMAVASVVVIASRGWRRPDLLVPLIVCTVFTFDSIRNAPFLYIAAVVLCAPMVRPHEIGALSSRRDLAVVGSVSAVVLALITSVGSIAATGDPAGDVPVGSVEALPAGCQLRNDYRDGGPTVLLRPDLKISVDGRNDLYGLDGYSQIRWFEDAGAAEDAPGVFAREGTTCVLAELDSPLIPVLVEAGWTEVGRDRAAVALLAP